MKRDRVEWLVNRLKNEVTDAQFRMRAWLSSYVLIDDDNYPEYDSFSYHGEESIPPCKTAGCMAGTVFLGLTAEKRLELAQAHAGALSDLPRITAKLELGLTMPEAQDLFEPFMAGRHFDRITRDMAINLLENMLVSSEINWSVVVPADIIPYCRPARHVEWT